MTPNPHRLATILTLALLAVPAAGAASAIERRFDVPAAGRLEVDSEGASVEITTGGAGGARVSISRGTDDEAEILEDYRFDIRQEGDLLRVELERRRPWRLFDFGSHSPEIEIELPRQFTADVVTSGGAVSIEDLDGAVKARTSGGSIRLAAIGGPVLASTSGGSIRLVSSAGDADLRTSGGSISIERASGRVTATTSGGSIEIEDVRGAIVASTSGGSVRAYLSEPPAADSQLRTSGGGITVYLDSAIGVDLDARASGRVTSDFEVAGGERDDDMLVGAINGGGPALLLRTSGGGIRVLRR